MKARQRWIHMIQLLTAVLIVGSLLCPNSHAVQTNLTTDIVVKEPTHILNQAQHRKLVDDRDRLSLPRTLLIHAGHTGAVVRELTNPQGYICRDTLPASQHDGIRCDSF